MAVVHIERWWKEGDVLLLSGGIDSVAAWVLLRYPPTLHFRFDTPYAAHEEARYRALLGEDYDGGRYHRVIGGFEKFLGSAAVHGKATEVPLRNLLMANVAWSLGYNNVILAAATDWAPDKRWLFAKSAAWSARIALGEKRPLRVSLPFVHWTKARLIKTAVAEQGTWWLRYLYSCYRGTGVPCGTCHPCCRAIVAFAAAGVTPPHDTWRMTWQREKSWSEFVRWAMGDAPRWWAPGSAVLGLLRIQELRQAYRNAKRV